MNPVCFYGLGPYSGEFVYVNSKFEGIEISLGFPLKNNKRNLIAAEEEEKKQHFSKK